MLGDLDDEPGEVAGQGALHLRRLQRLGADVHAEVAVPVGPWAAEDRAEGRRLEAGAALGQPAEAEPLLDTAVVAAREAGERLVADHPGAVERADRLVDGGQAVGVGEQVGDLPRACAGVVADHRRVEHHQRLGARGLGAVHRHVGLLDALVDAHPGLVHQAEPEARRDVEGDVPDRHGLLEAADQALRGGASAAPASTPSKSTPNSSPPRRATTSPGRTAARKRWPTTFSSASRPGARSGRWPP